MKTLPRSTQLAVVGFIGGFVAMYIATSNVVLALLVGAVVFGLFFMGVIKAR
ncbi:MAG: hypothetical protein MUF38_11340 [Anaerolineae bacterium]|nr:hypothetical protein [Anaerolineae bacterium]